MTWAATQAKAKFSELLDKAEEDGPQVIRRRKQVFYVLTREQHEDRNRLHLDKNKHPEPGVRTLADFFRNSPLAKYGVEIKRIRSKPRPVDL